MTNGHRYQTTLTMMVIVMTASVVAVGCSSLSRGGKQKRPDSTDRKEPRGSQAGSAPAVPFILGGPTRADATGGNIVSEPAVTQPGELEHLIVSTCKAISKSAGGAAAFKHAETFRLKTKRAFDPMLCWCGGGLSERSTPKSSRFDLLAQRPKLIAKVKRARWYRLIAARGMASAEGKLIHRAWKQLQAQEGFSGRVSFIDKDGNDTVVYCPESKDTRRRTVSVCVARISNS